MTARPPKPISVADLVDDLRVVAEMVSKDGGEVYLPIFVRLEREIADRRSKEDTLARARAVAHGHVTPA